MSFENSKGDKKLKKELFVCLHFRQKQGQLQMEKHIRTTTEKW
jgi:hypothetical protein